MADQTLPPSDQSRAGDEADVPLEWRPGEVVQDLYEVLTVTEGLGEDAEQKGFHEGGMGRVYRVLHRQWGLDLAVKTPLSRYRASKTLAIS